MYIQLDNQVLYYEKTGETGPEVVLLHGNGESHEIFDELVSKLREDHQVITMDSRGHGLSATPSELHYADMAGDVINLITELELSGQHIYTLWFLVCLMNLSLEYLS